MDCQDAYARAHLRGPTREGLDRPEPRPTVRWGYGGFRIANAPSFVRFRLPFTADGGVYTSVCARGGRGFGEPWREAGMGQHKQHPFDDFLAAAEYLLEAGYTSPDRLAVTGRSNGGLAVGAVLTQRPDLSAAAVSGVPLFDRLRFDECLLGESWTPEYGSPVDAEEVATLKAYSPYHQIEPRRYPPVLFRTAEGDTRVHPAHARETAARLQAEAEGGPFLLRTDDDTGHGVGKPSWLEVEEALDEWSSPYERLGLGSEGPSGPNP